MNDDNLDAWFRILANEHRRTAVRLLREHDEIGLRDLAHAVAHRTRKQPGAPTRLEFDQALTALVHVHLPLMDGSGIVDWDRETNVVRGIDLDDKPGVN